jgi:hypothetical protein
LLSFSHWKIISKFLFKDAHGRELFKWKAFRDDIHADDTSSEEAKAHADLLWSTANADDVPMDESGEWHHLWPLGVFGSVEDIRNYHRVSIIDHIKLHAALIFFFPWLIELHLALGILLSQAETAQGKKKTGKVSNEILEECLSGTVRTKLLRPVIVLPSSYRRDALRLQPVIALKVAMVAD